MAKNNNRIPVKWVRDKAKRAYEKQDHCYICNTSADLELHHLASVTYLLNTWAQKRGYDISTDSGILQVRDEFIGEHHKELYLDVFTLCNKHHVQLHSVYGKIPAITSVEKQRNWIEIQKQKQTGDISVKPKSNLFAKFL